MKTDRIVWVDYAKAFGIFLVILAHTHLYKPLQDWICVFHMPLFFFISGYLFSYDRHPSLSSFAISRFKRLIVPYMFLNAISYMAWLLLLRNVGIDNDDTVEWWNPLLYAVLGTGDKMIHDVPLWFFMCLYVVEILFYITFRSSKYLLSLFVFFVIGYLNYRYNAVRLPFSMGTAFVAIVFYALGFKAKDVHVLDNHKGYRLAMLAMSFVTTIVVACLNGRINMHMNYYGDYILFFIGAIAGISMMFCLCNMLSYSKIIALISRLTLLICGLHLLSFAFIKGVMLYVLNVSPAVLDGGVLGNVVFSLISLCLTLCAAMVINKTCPYLAGNMNRKAR